MQPDPKDEKKPQSPASEQVANAHAAGDGALERSDASVESGPDAEKKDLHAEDQNHIPY